MQNTSQLNPTYRPPTSPPLLYTPTITHHPPSSPPSPPHHTNSSPTQCAETHGKVEDTLSKIRSVYWDISGNVQKVSTSFKDEGVTEPLELKEKLMHLEDLHEQQVIHTNSHTLIHSYTHTLIYSYTHKLIHSYTHTLICSYS